MILKLSIPSIDAFFDDGVLILTVPPEDLAQDMDKLDPTDLLDIMAHSDKAREAGLETVLALLEQSDTLDGLERILSLLDRLKGAAGYYLTELVDGQIYVGREALPLSGGYRVLTADERARIVVAVGNAPRVRGVDLGSPDGDKSVETIAHREGDAAVIDSVREIPAQDSGTALVGVECYFADFPEKDCWTFLSSRICDDFDGKRYRDQHGMRWNHARPAALGLPS